MAPTRKLAELFYDLRARTEGLQKDLDQSERAFGKLTSFVLRNPVAALAAVGTAALGAAAKASQMATEIDSSMRRVAASVPKGTAGLSALRQELENISKATGKSQSELGQAAEVIARTGAGSAEEVASRLRAAVDASQATGTDLQVVIAGLDQTLDLFGISSADASVALAELFSIARGKTSLEDLFASLQAAAPGIQKLGLDLPTAARALVQLGESGLSTKQAAGELKALAEGGAAGRQEIERLAATIPAAANPMQELARAAKDVNDSAANASARIRAELNATLIELGNQILPAVNAAMQQLLRFLGRGDFDVKNIENAKVALLAMGEAGQQLFTGREQGAVEAQRAVLLLAEAAKSGTVSFRDLGEKGIKALQARVDYFAKSRFLQGHLADIRVLQAELQKAGEAATRASGPLGRATRTTGGGGGVASVATDPEAEQLSRNFQELVDLGPALARFYDDERKRRMQLNEALVATGRATVATMRQLLLDLQAEFEKQGFSKAQARILADAKLGIKTAKTDLDAASKGLNELNQKTDESRKKTQKSAEEQARAEELAKLRAQSAARAIEDVGRLVLGAADAFGVLSDEAAKALNAVIDVGAGLARIAAGDLKGGGLQLATGVIGLASQAFGNDPAAAERQKQHQENLSALKEIAKHTGDLVGVSTSGSAIDAVKKALEENLTRTAGLSATRNAAANLTRPGALSAATGLSVKEIEELARSLGITLNTTRQSYVDFLNQLKQLDLEAFGKGFSGQIRKLEIAARLDPKAFEGIEGIIARLKVLAGPDGAPAIAKALEGIDTNTSSGRAEAIARLTRTLQNLSSLDVADLGGLSLDQFIEEILSAIEKLRALDGVAKSAGEQFADAMELLGLQVELGGVDVAARLEKTKAAFESAFGDAFADLDFSSLESLQSSIAGIIASLTADGVLTEEEKALAAALRTLLDAFKDATPAATQFSDALDVLSDRFEIFGTSAVGQFKALGDALGEQFPTIGELLQGIDIENDPKALDTLKARAQAIFDALAEGGVTTEEQAIIDAMKQILKAAGAAADEIADAETKKIEERTKARQRILDGAENDIRLNDVTDPVEQLQIRVRALGKAFPELGDALGQFDLATQDGRDALEAWIRQMIDSPEALEAMAKVMGVTVEELVDTLLGLEDGADSATQAVQSLADKLQTAFDEIDFSLFLDNITDPIEKLQRYAKGIASTIPEIDQALRGIDLTTVEGRRKAEAALVALGSSTSDATIRKAIEALLPQLRGITATAAAGGAAAGAPSPLSSGRANVQSAASITEVTANRWLDVMTTDLALSRDRNALLQAIFASVASAPAIGAPAFARNGASAGQTIFNIEIPVNFNGPVTTSDVTELAATLQRSLYEFVTQQLAVDLTAAQRLAGRAVA